MRTHSLYPDGAIGPVGRYTIAMYVWHNGKDVFIFLGVGQVKLEKMKLFFLYCYKIFRIGYILIKK